MMIQLIKAGHDEPSSQSHTEPAQWMASTFAHSSATEMNMEGIVSYFVLFLPTYISVNLQLVQVSQVWLLVQCQLLPHMCMWLQFRRLMLLPHNSREFRRTPLAWKARALGQLQGNEPSELASNGYLYHIESWSRLRRQDYLFEIPSRYLASCRVIKTSYKSELWFASWEILL